MMNKEINRTRIIKFISEKKMTSKNEIANALHLSMPTTLQNVKELTDAGIVVECGEYQSTGGRKAKALSVADDIGYVAGMDITANHITFVLINMRREILRQERIRIPYEDTYSYYEKMGEELQKFLGKTDVKTEKIVGVGISLPGIVDKEEKVLLTSHALGVKNVSFRDMEKFLGFPYELENDANSAAYAELEGKVRNTVYLSLSNTVGGAIYLHDQMYPGEDYRSGEFGHMIIERNGRSCYCGKRGCVDAYCSAKVLQRLTDDNLELFFERLRAGDSVCMEAWDEYLEYLAITVTNLRMAFDCDVVLGGYVGGYLEEFKKELNQRVLKYNNFDLDTFYLKTGKFKLEASAYGVTLRFVKKFFENI